MDEPRIKYPIAEIFDSLQGEGEHAGRRMLFIRTAGCSVGKPWPGNEPFEKCVSATGIEFKCDTDFRRHEFKTVEELVNMVPDGLRHVCLTGGEPFNHNLLPLIEAFYERSVTVHIETSGTVIPQYWDEIKKYHDADYGNLWLTVSPKMGYSPEMVRHADEVKLLVDSKFDVASIPQCILNHRGVFIQPINGVYTLDRSNLKRAIEIVLQFPQFRLSTQLHKVWAVR